MKINLCPSDIKVFRDCKDKKFYLVTNEEFSNSFELENDNKFLSINTVFLSNDVSFDDLLKTEISDNACVLVISPNVFFQSPEQEKIGKRRIIAMACNSTPTDINDIEHFLECLINTDPIEQQQKTDLFFEVGENANFLQFIDSRNQTSATFNHLDESYLWSEQTGILNDGEQQLAPSGEISVLPIAIQEFDEKLRLDFSGTIALHGTPILHSGTPSFTRKDQLRIYNNLAHMSEEAVIATVEKGVIVKLTSTGEKSKKAIAMLECMFETDSRYRILWEIGFGINRHIKIRSGNQAMNETYGAENGCIHFGLGLTPYTQYHLDIVCPNMNVLTDSGDLLIGKKVKKMRSVKNNSTNCLCSEG